MKTSLSVLAWLLTACLLAACATADNGRVRDAGREIRSEDGHTTLQQSIRF
ncbi:MAG: hypothetical protein LBK71_02790 [Verrucomicrobiales bacterium]|jgi:predicted small secreted protein|nr:hypothetical protein [Verrucomicrobiales bacterium]